MKHEEPISASLYSCAANAIRSLSDHYKSMLAAGIPKADVLARLVGHLDRINESTASEEQKSRARSELLDFAKDNTLVSNQQEWDVVSGLFDDWTPEGWIREDLDEGMTTSTAAGDTGTHVLFRLNRFHGIVNGKPVKPMTEPELHRHLVRDHGYDRNKAADMIANFKTGSCPSGERQHSSTGMVDGALHHAGAALASHLAGNHGMRDSHLKCADAQLDRAFDSLNKQDNGSVHAIPNRLRTLHNTLQAIR